MARKSRPLANIGLLISGLRSAPDIENGEAPWPALCSGARASIRCGAEARKASRLSMQKRFDDLASRVGVEGLRMLAELLGDD
jgi:hypothetical protein